MSRTVSLPDDVVRKAEELAKREGVSLDTFVADSLKDQFAGLEYLETRADEQRFRSALAQIPDVPAEPNDRL